MLRKLPKLQIRQTLHCVNVSNVPKTPDRAECKSAQKLLAEARLAVRVEREASLVEPANRLPVHSGAAPDGDAMSTSEGSPIENDEELDFISEIPPGDIEVLHQLANDAYAAAVPDQAWQDADTSTRVRVMRSVWNAAKKIKMESTS